MKYRKKPVVIDAWLFTPGKGPRPPCIAMDPAQISAEKPVGYNPFVCEIRVPNGATEIAVPPLHAWIKTLEGTMLVSPGDYIIRGVAGEYYPCKPEIFAATYEEVADALPPCT